MNPLIITAACVAALAMSAIIAALVGSRDRLAIAVGSVGSATPCALGIAASSYALFNGCSDSLNIPWTLPMGAFHLALDSLSAFFLLCLFLVSGINSVFAAGYLRVHASARTIPTQFAFHNLLISSMALLILARDGVLFIMAWEAMSIASFFLVATDHDDVEVRRAGYLYLVASHLGTVCLFLMFAVLARTLGSFDFDAWTAARSGPGHLSNLIFLLAVVGFGTKAGFWPTHVWLPQAHPAAPSPVSALMSGVMIKMGIYGLVRTLQFLGPPPAWWGLLLIGIGLVSGVLGVLLALTQHDLKRLLAYHSVENIGIIALGLGVGVLGQSQGRPSMAFFGFGGALLHVLNHALFKSLLFQAAGNVALATGQRNIQSLGGLSKRMPLTSMLFLVGSMAICGLPPFNGFVSEWLIYVGAFQGSSELITHCAAGSILALCALALMGGLALTCFVKAFGVVFLGEPRSAAAQEAQEVGTLMTLPMTVSASLCVLIGTYPALALRLVRPAVGQLTASATVPLEADSMLAALARVGAALVGLVLLLAAARGFLLRRRVVASTATWGCGYVAPTPRMQYSAGSFAAPVLFIYRPLLGTKVNQEPVRGYFPQTASYEEDASDLAQTRMVLPAASAVLRVAARIRMLQHGRVQLYLVYIFGTLIGLLMWQLTVRGQ
jgi:hydrogenase-4 component B